MVKVVYSSITYNTERPPSLSYCCHGVSNSGARTWTEPLTEGVRETHVTAWLPGNSSKTLGGSGYLLEPRFFEKMSSVVPSRRIVNDKGKSCYAFLNSPSWCMQITLSCCSLFFQGCSFLKWTLSCGRQETARHSLNHCCLIFIHLFHLFSSWLYWTRCTFLVNPQTWSSSTDECC